MRAARIAGAVVVIGVAAVAARKAIVTHTQNVWAERAASAVTRNHPTWEVSRLAPTVLGVTYRGSRIDIQLGNMRRNADDDPERFEEEVLRAAESGAHILDGARSSTGTLERFESARMHLYPVPVPRDFAHAQKLVTLPLVGDVLEAFVFDGEHHQHYVNESTFAEWGVTAGALHDAAMAALSSRIAAETWPAPTRPTEPAASGAFIALDMSDGYAAARLLAPEARERLGKALGYPFFAGIPNRDILVAWSNDHAYAENFTAKLREDFARRSYPVSPEVFRVDAAGISLVTHGAH